MSNKKEAAADPALCPLMFALQRLGGRWTLVILRELMNQPLRFNQLKRRLPEIAGKSLARMLERLRKEGLVRRTVHPEELRTATYSVVRADPGLRHVIEVITQWGKENFLRRSAEQWKRCIQELPDKPATRISPFILASWERCRKAGLDPAPDEVVLRRVPERELRQRLARNQQLLHVVTLVLGTPSRKLSSIPHVLYLADEDGIVLHSTGDNALIQAWGLTPGCDWSEKTMGTNGAGTALTLKKPVVVVGPEHYNLSLHDANCLAAPICSPKGQVIAAIDLCTHVADAKPVQLAMIVELAKKIERKLAATQRPLGATRG